MESKISLSKINLRSQDAWGPDQSYVFEQYRNLPFAPFNKLEKLGRFCDISNPMNKPPVATSTIASAVTLEEEAAFVPVEVKMAAKKDKRAPIRRPVTQQQATVRQPMTVAQNKLYKMPTKQQHRNYNPRTQVTKTKFKESSTVQADWQFIIDANKTNFDKTHVGNVKVSDIGIAGAVPEYDKTWDGKPKKNVPFTLPNTISITGGPRSDRFLLEEIKKNQDTNELTVYTTDLLLSVLLTSKNSNFPWDIIAVKEGNQIFLEPANQKNSLNYIDILSVNENTAGSLPEDEKDLLKACIESTNTNRKFIEMTTKASEPRDFTTLKGADAPDRKAYRYRKWNIDNKVNIVVRSEVDAFVKEGDGTSFVKVCALNEYQPQQDWKQNYELNKGAVISSELRNNLNKICRWLCQALLADCSQVKLGFVTKQNVKDGKYYVLTVEDMTTNSLSNTINYRLKDSWNIVKTLVDVLSKQDDGTYAFVKQAYKPGIRVYRAPEQADESDE